jgi:hypothetical protein
VPSDRKNVAFQHLCPLSIIHVLITALIAAVAVNIVLDATQHAVSSAATTKPLAEFRGSASLRRLGRSCHRRSNQLSCLLASYGSTSSTAWSPMSLRLTCPFNPARAVAAAGESHGAPQRRRQDSDLQLLPPRPPLHLPYATVLRSFVEAARLPKALPSLLVPLHPASNGRDSARSTSAGTRCPVLRTSTGCSSVRARMSSLADPLVWMRKQHLKNWN